MVFIARQEKFTCLHCGVTVEPLAKGSYRNHCPMCLWSLHVDEKGPGDRKSLCQALMEPVLLDQQPKKGWRIQHRCIKCEKEIFNKVAPDDALVAFLQSKEKSFNEKCLHEAKKKNIMHKNSLA